MRGFPGRLVSKRPTGLSNLPPVCVCFPKKQDIEFEFDIFEKILVELLFLCMSEFVVARPNIEVFQQL